MLIILVMLCSSNIFGQTKIFEQSLPGGVFRHVSLSNDGRYVLAQRDFTLYCFDITTGILRDSVVVDINKYDQLPKKTIDQIAFSPDNKSYNFICNANAYNVDPLTDSVRLIYQPKVYQPQTNRIGSGEKSMAISRDGAYIYTSIIYVSDPFRYGNDIKESFGDIFGVKQNKLLRESNVLFLRVKDTSVFLKRKYRSDYYGSGGISVPGEDILTYMINKDSIPANSDYLKVYDVNSNGHYSLCSKGIYNIYKRRIDIPLQLPVVLSDIPQPIYFSGILPQSTGFISNALIYTLNEGKAQLQNLINNDTITLNNISEIARDIHFPGGKRLAYIADSTIVICDLSYNTDEIRPAFSASKDSVSIGDKIQLTNYCYPTDSIKSYKWEFGDGRISFEENPTIVYEKQGSYTVKLTATLMNGKTIELEKKNCLKVYFKGQDIEWIKALQSIGLNSLAYSSDGSLLCAGALTWPAYLLNARNGNVHKEISIAGKKHSYIHSIMFNPLKDTVYCVAYSGPYQVQDRESPNGYSYDSYESCYVGPTAELYLYAAGMDNSTTVYDSTARILCKVPVTRIPWNIETQKGDDVFLYIKSESTDLRLQTIWYQDSILLNSFMANQVCENSPLNRPNNKKFVEFRFDRFTNGSVVSFNTQDYTRYFRNSKRLLSKVDTSVNTSTRIYLYNDTTARAAYGIAGFPEGDFYITSENPEVKTQRPTFLNYTDYKTKSEFRRYADSAWALRRSPDAVHILTNNGLFDVYQGVYSSLHPYLKNYRTFEYFPDGIHVALFSGGSDSSVRIYNLLKKQIVWGTGKLPSAARCMALSPDGMHLALGLEQNSIIQISLPKLQKMYEIGFGLAKVNLPRDHDTLHFVNSSLPANDSTMSYLWDFGDGSKSTEKSPYHSYALPGTYKVVLQAFKGDSLIGAQVQRFSIGQSVLGIVEAIPAQTIYAAPNPSTAECQIHTSLSEIARVEVYDIQGKAQAIDWYTEGAGIIRLRHSSLSPGHYHVQIYDMQSKVHSIDLFIHH